VILSAVAMEPWEQPGPGEVQALAAAWVSSGHGGVPSLDAGGLATRSGPLDRSRPWVLRGLTDDWPALAWAHDPSELLARYGHVNIKPRACETLQFFGSPGPAASATKTLAEYFSDRGSDNAPAPTTVLFENAFHKVSRLLVRDRAYTVPSLLRDVHANPVFSGARAGTGVGFHAHEEAWLAQLVGRKLWWLCAPGVGSKRPAVSRPPWQYLREDCQPEGPVHFCVAMPGDIVFVPSRWWHATWNPDDFTLAVGWEGGDSEHWGPAMHAIVDGDLHSLRSISPPANREAMWPAIVVAARTGDCSVLELLLDRALGDVGDVDLPSCACLLPLSAFRIAAIIESAGNGHVNALRLLVARGVVDNITACADRRGTTPLHAAARCGHVAAVTWLFAQGAKAHVLDHTDAAPLHYAAYYGHAQVVELLLAARARVDAPDASGTAALAAAASNGHAAVVKLVIGARAQLDKTDLGGKTALHRSAHRGVLHVTRQLLAAQADVTASDMAGRTPLHLVGFGRPEGGEGMMPFSVRPEEIERLHVAVAIELILAGADLFCVDSAGKNPTKHAIEGKRLLLAKLLELFESGSASVAIELDNRPESDRSRFCSFAGFEPVS